MSIYYIMNMLNIRNTTSQGLASSYKRERGKMDDLKVRLQPKTHIRQILGEADAQTANWQNCRTLEY